ncbi:MAG TPA: fibrobacter succinogenes major paralogous domain-containing protein [Paludibacter sp.]|nr:fibrobacter succinogenes major paralogous domain-containing protein [Paludibacter sp.]
MKKQHLVLISLIALFILFNISGCKEKDIAAIPTVVTFPISDIELHTATCGGFVNSNNSPIITSGLCLSKTNESPNITDSIINSDIQSESFSIIIENLVPEITYYVRAFATNKAGTGYGSVMKFRTRRNNISVLTLTVSDVSQFTATCGGIITADEPGTMGNYGVCWSDTTSKPTINNNKTSENGGIVSFTSLITGLTINTTYYVRAYLTSAEGTVYGSTMSFKTTPGMATIKTNSVYDITDNSAKGEIQFINNGGSNVTNIGICWGNSMNPTFLSNNNNSTSTSTVKVSLNMTGLKEYTIYFARAFVSNAYGTSYGENIKFTTTGTSANKGIKFKSGLNYGSISDIDGNIYKTITIGTQTWMAENLRVTRFRNGELIPTKTLDDTFTESVEKYQFEQMNPEVYGKLYSWYAATDSRNICPEGYHLPSEEEWNTLINYLGGSSIAGSKMKEEGLIHWITNTSATNESGMTALPAGFLNAMQSMTFNSGTSNWWASNTYKPDSGISIYLIGNSSNTQKMNANRNSALSIRCIKD